ncbi:MAG: copper chaperone PCu(A)C, partial [Pseudomonadota bacterium]
MNRIKTILAVGLLAGLVGAPVHAEGQVSAEEAWIREAPPGVSAMAGYLTLHNHGKQPRTLSAAHSPAFDSVMLHRTV